MMEAVMTFCADQFSPHPVFSQFQNLDPVFENTGDQIISARPIDDRAQFAADMNKCIAHALKDGASPHDVIRSLNSSFAALTALPHDFSMPSLAIDEEGNVLFDWIQSKEVMLSAIFSGGKIIYSSYIRGQSDNAEFDVANENGLSKFAEIAEGWRRQA